MLAPRPGAGNRPLAFTSAGDGKRHTFRVNMAVKRQKTDRYAGRYEATKLHPPLGQEFMYLGRKPAGHYFLWEGL